MIKHLVLVKFRPDVTKKQIAELLKSTARLPPAIPEIKKYDFGLDRRPDRYFDFALTSEFSDTDALERYKNHKEHVPVGQYIRSLSEEIRIVDFEF